MSPRVSVSLIYYSSLCVLDGPDRCSDSKPQHVNGCRHTPLIQIIHQGSALRKSKRARFNSCTKHVAHSLPQVTQFALSPFCLRRFSIRSLLLRQYFEPGAELIDLPISSAPT